MCFISFGQLTVTNQPGRRICPDQDMFPDYMIHHLSLLIFAASITRGNFDDNRLSALGFFLYIRLYSILLCWYPQHAAILTQLEDLLPLNGNCISNNNEASGWYPLWILFTPRRLKYNKQAMHVRIDRYTNVANLFIMRT